MAELTNSAILEVMGSDVAHIRTEMEKRVEYTGKVRYPKDAGNTVYEQRDGRTVITMYVKLPEDFFEIAGEQFALGAENDAYEFRCAESCRKDFETYMASLRENLEPEGIGFYPVIYCEKERKAYGFPCSLRGIVSINAAKRDYALYAACVKAVKNGSSAEENEETPAFSAAEDKAFLTGFIHEKRRALIQKPEIIGEKRSLDEMDPLMRFQTFGITPFFAGAFFVAAYFSWGMQTTHETGWAQTLFLLAMGIGFIVFTVYNTAVRAKKIKKYNENVRETNRRSRDAYEAALAAEDERYEQEKEK